jgi:6-pyruvoyltetrahydropterin/6-carboxytetrahydropterin synthase
MMQGVAVTLGRCSSWTILVCRPTSVCADRGGPPLADDEIAFPTRGGSLLTCTAIWSYCISVSLSVVRRYRFEAAHRLEWHPGRCRQLHGHSYVLEVEVSGELDGRGVVMDFAEVDKVVVDSVLYGPDGLDHAYLNERLTNPTAELVLVLIGERLDAAGLPWTRVRLWETEDGSVILER